MEAETQRFGVPALLRSFGERMRLSLREDLVPQRGELGTAREEVVRQFFRKYLPTRFGVSTGFVFDWKGNVSKQADIVIFDASVSPQFESVGEKTFYPCEAVVAAGQVKSVLRSRSEVAKALDNLHSIKALDRSAGGASFSYRDGVPLNPCEDHLDQIFTFLFVTGRAMKPQTMRTCFVEYMRTHERFLWPNVCFAFDQYLLSYCCPEGACPNPMHALGFSVTSEKFAHDELLLRFYNLVGRATAATRVSPFPYWEYLRLHEAPSMDIEPFDDPELDY